MGFHFIWFVIDNLVIFKLLYFPLSVNQLRLLFSNMRTRYGKLKNMKSGLAAPEFTERDQYIFTAFQFLGRHNKRVGSRQSAKVYRPQHKNIHFIPKTSTQTNDYVSTHNHNMYYLFVHTSSTGLAILMYYAPFVLRIVAVPWYWFLFLVQHCHVLWTWL